jgi:hypothetical protein
MISQQPKKIFAVLGASGVQGRSIIEQVTSNPTLSSQFAIRAISRDPDSIRSQPWVTRVSDFVRADNDDPASLRAAFESVHTVFGLTNYWEHCDLARDIQQGKNIVDAAKAASVTHLIWSGQPSAAKVSGDPTKRVGTLDGKWLVGEYAELVKARAPRPMLVTSVWAGFYMQNLPKFMVWPDPRDGVLTWRFPWHTTGTKACVFDVAGDMGKYVAGVMLRELEVSGSMDGRRLHLASEWTTVEKMAEEFEQVTGKVFRHVDVDADGFRATMPEPYAAELHVPMCMYRETPLFGSDGRETQKDHDQVLEGVGRPTTWAEYVRRDWENDWHG